MLKKLLGFFCLIFAKSAMVTPNAEHEINWWHLGPTYKDSPALGWLILTFCIFVYLIARMIHKPLALFLETRSKDIKRQIEEGKRAKAESEEKVRMYEEKLRSLGQEINRLKESFMEQAQAEKRERDQKLIEMEKRILQDADDSIRANFERTKNRLADEVVNKALAMAEETIAPNKNADAFLKTSFINDLKSVGKEGRVHVPTTNRATLRKRPYLIS